MRWPLPVAAAGLLALLPGTGRAADATEYLSDGPERLALVRQDWGALGFDLAAHAPDKAGQPLQIGAERFDKGLGHHANGAIHVLLDGEFDRFEASVGLQPCAGGSVVFRVVVDGTARFESGVVRSGDAPQPVSVPLTGAQELVLEALDAGDGISCDMANWAGARLHRTGTSPSRATEPGVDIAPFGRVVTSDPSRTTGTRAGRIEEFPAEDLFLETDLVPDAQARFRVPIAAGHQACIGLQWLNRRAIRELQLEFADAAQCPPPDQVRLEGWFGESIWQGDWKRLDGDFASEGPRLCFRPSAKSPAGGLLLTRKVRWIWRTSAPEILVRHPVAYTRTRWVVTNIRIEIERGQPPEPREVHVEDGAWAWAPPDLVRDGRGRRVLGYLLAPGTAGTAAVRHAAPSTFGSESTLLHLALNDWRTAVAIEDILSHDGVYLPEAGVFLCRADRPISLAAYKHQIAGRRTIREEVRSMPDQTLEQAMARTHREAQHAGPVLLSLACDNHKVVVERDGTVRFSALPATRPDWAESAGFLRPEFGAAAVIRRERRLEGGWLPVPIITVIQTNLVWHERTFVAPVTDASPDPADLYRPRASACVVEFEATNTADAATEAAVDIVIQHDGSGRKPATLTRCVGGYFILRDQTLIGRALTDSAAPLAASAEGGTLRVRGVLPPRSSASFAVLLPANPEDLLTLPDRRQLLGQTQRYWERILAAGAQVETPDRFLNDLVRSSQVRCLIAARHEAGGERIAPWIAAMSYGPLESESHAVIRGMDFMGHTEFARRSLEYFIHRYNTNGFLTTGYTTFGTAWHLWTLGEHPQLTSDRAWLEKAAPELKRVGRWILSQTAKTRALDPDGHARLVYGLMPPGVLADWNAYAYHFCLNAYYAAALETLGIVLVDLGDPEARAFAQGGFDLAANTYFAFRSCQARSPAVPLRNGTWVRYYPSQVHSPGKLGDFFPGEDGNRSWCYDVELGAHQLVTTGVLGAQAGEEIEGMLDHMEDVQFLESGWFDYPAEQNRRDWFNLGGFSKVQPYYTRNGEIYAMRDDVKPFIRSYFNTLAAMVNPEVMTFWEHFNHSGAWDKTHETGYFLHQTRSLLATERGEELWLAPLVTSNWLKEGNTVRVDNAPTRFGPVSYRLESHIARRHIDARIEPPARQPPQRIVLRVRHPDGKPMRSVRVNGRKHKDWSRQTETVTLPATAGTLDVEVRY